MTQVAPWVQKIVEDALGSSHMEVGAIITHPDGYRVKVLDGQYWGTYGLSNFWTWRRVDKNGRPYGKKVSGYGW